MKAIIGGIMAVLIVAAAACFICVWHEENNRFSVSVGTALPVPYAYKIDKRTGQTWYLKGNGKYDSKNTDSELLFKQADDISRDLGLIK